jgi:hypothetical protein
MSMAHSDLYSSRSRVRPKRQTGRMDAAVYVNPVETKGSALYPDSIQTLLDLSHIEGTNLTTVPTGISYDKNIPTFRGRRFQ